jgi:hypothetical protein
VTNPLVSPDDDDTYDRVGSVLAAPAEVHTPILLLAPIVVSPENFSNFSFPVGFGSA